MEAFSRSSRHEEDNDEEALKWAALEKLPTYNRLRKGLLTTSRGVANEIDITELGFQERQKLLDRLINVAEEDNETLLLKLKERIDRVGIDIPTIEVRYEHLNVEAEAYVGSRALPTFLNFVTNMVESFFTSLHILSGKKKHVTILRDVSGIIKPRRMALLLGPPSSGKTTLLLALSGKLDPTLKAAATGGQEASLVTDYVLKPAPETYELFDDIVLISDGQIVYQGPREYVLEFFEYVGFQCPERKGVADFLQEVTSRKDQEQYWIHRDESYRFVTVTEFAEAFQSFHVGRRIGEELATPFDKSKSHPAALTTKKYGVNKKELLKANFSREYLLMKRNSFVYIFKLFQLTILAILTMTMFLRTEMHRNSLNDGGVYTGALFFAVVILMFNGLAEISMTIVKLPIFYKQRDLLFYPSWAYAIPSWILKIPITFIEAAVWVFLTYYVIGFDPNVGRLLKQYLVLLLINQMSSGLFRAIAALGRNMIVASTFGSFALLVLFALGGFVLSRNDIKNWWIWGYWISPLMYGQNAIVVNEFLGDSWNHFTPNSNKTLGIQILESRGFFTHAYWYWIGIGALIGFMILFNIIYTLALTYLNPYDTPQTTITEESESAGRKTGGYIEGNIKVSGYPKRQETFARISGYCEQNDIHSPHVTVYESLVYSAWLRLPAEVEAYTRKMFIEEVMELVELNPLRNSLVGLPGVNGLSTEQRKRLTIAVELVANPSIIFMDEPTSGLDARAAAIVMRTVRNTVDTGRTVVCTIHQPSIDIFEAFDEVLEDVFYSSSSISLESDMCYMRNKRLISELGNPAPGSKDLHFPTQYPQSLLVQCLACLWKQHWSYWRNPPYTAVRFLSTTVTAVLFGTMFWDLGGKYSSRQDLFNAMGSMYNAVLFVGVQNSASVQPVVAIERTVFYRERAAGMYSALPYALAQVIIELPYVFVQATSYSVIVYAMMGFEWTLQKFFWYVFFMYFTLCYFTFYGMMTVAVTPNHHVASVVASAFYGIWNLFSGFVIARPSIPVWWRWYYWACPVAWTIYGLVASQFGDITNVMKSENINQINVVLRVSSNAEATIARLLCLVEWLNCPLDGVEWLYSQIESLEGVLEKKNRLLEATAVLKVAHTFYYDLGLGWWGTFVLVARI
ncbi:hypothetical protein JHK82_017427 [Glycine max]|nr:hypothetical protein JHK82_017427 [Glycine max]